VSNARSLSRSAARLAAVLPSPRRFKVAQPSPYVLGRAAWIQQQMGQLGGPGYLRGDTPAQVRRTR